MCMMLYAATANPMRRKAWLKESPDLSVEDLDADELPVKVHFRLSEVQNIGSTSGCGCDFPHACFAGNGGWSEYEIDDEDELNMEEGNRKGLVEILRAHGEPEVELYALW